MLTIATFYSIKLVFRTVNFIFAKELILGTDHASDIFDLLEYDSRAFRDKLTLEDAIDTDSSVITERDRLSPGVTFLEEDMFKVGCDEGVLDRVAIVIKSLHGIFPPAFAQPERPSEEDLVELNQ